MNISKGMRFAAWYCISVGFLMGGQWFFLLASGNVPELTTEPRSIAFHLVAEFGTAFLLLVGGIGLLRGWGWAVPVSLVALGMLLYTLVNSAGYFAELDQWGMVAMFAVLLLLTVVCMWSLVTHARRTAS